MSTAVHLSLTEIEPRLLDLISLELGIERNKLQLTDRIVQDLHCDSLDLVELLLTLEESFQVSLPNKSTSPVYKSIFTRQPFRLSDFAELIYVQQGTGAPPRRSRWYRSAQPAPQQPAPTTPFSQLDGVWRPEPRSSLLESLGKAGRLRQFRRRSDGMRCIEIPSAEVPIGSEGPYAFEDEKPCHIVGLDSFLIDAEPVSTTAYCRFLNSIGEVAPTTLSEWFVLTPDDDRASHMLIEQNGGPWRPVAGAERQPMILVSWYGANAYSLWANSRDWKLYSDGTEQHTSWLPTEAQWEYAARGATGHEFPWGDAPPTHEQARFAQHCRARTYEPGVLPMAPVNEQLGMSPFGLHHTAGNVWQWCQDWYDESFYRRPQAYRRNPVNQSPTQVRSERGGSWVGPAELCRTPHRRGRPPLARGRCLGFRCATPVSEIR